MKSLSDKIGTTLTYDSVRTESNEQEKRIESRGEDENGVPLVRSPIS